MRQFGDAFLLHEIVCLYTNARLNHRQSTLGFPRCAPGVCSGPAPMAGGQLMTGALSSHSVTSFIASYGATALLTSASRVRIRLCLCSRRMTTQASDVLLRAARLLRKPPRRTPAGSAVSHPSSPSIHLPRFGLTLEKPCDPTGIGSRPAANIRFDTPNGGQQAATYDCADGLPDINRAIRCVHRSVAVSSATRSTS